MLVNILQVLLLDLPLQRILFPVQLVHVLPHEVLDVDVFIPRAPSRLVASSARTRLPALQMCAYRRGTSLV